jgi:hypothetical protein
MTHFEPPITWNDLQIPGFTGTRDESTESHLEMVQSAWVYEWRDNQK